MEIKNLQKLKHFFKTNPDSDEVHETSDGLLFYVKDNAVAHANGSAREQINFSKKINTYTRVDLEKPTLDNKPVDLVSLEKGCKDKEESGSGEAEKPTLDNNPVDLVSLEKGPKDKILEYMTLHKISFAPEDTKKQLIAKIEATLKPKE